MSLANSVFFMILLTAVLAGDTRSNSSSNQDGTINVNESNQVLLGNNLTAEHNKTEITGEQVDQINVPWSVQLVKKAYQYAQKMYHQVESWNEAEVARGHKKGLSMMGFLLIAGEVLQALFVALGTSGLFVIAGKALLAAVTSLVLSSIVGLKSFADGQKHYYTRPPVFDPDVDVFGRPPMGQAYSQLYTRQGY